MKLPQTIEVALSAVHDQRSFINELLVKTLQWPIDGAPQSIEEIAYGWTASELRAAGLDKTILGGQVLQIANLSSNQPWGVFVIEFKNPDAFLADRGMTGVLRKVLRGLVPSRGKGPGLSSWKREHLLFICTHNYEHFRFAYFKSPPDGSKTAPLAAFGWGPDIPARTACEFNLPPLAWPENAADGPAWVGQWAQAFDVEKVTKKFYTEYAAEDARLRQAVARVMKEDEKSEPVKMFVQTLLNRLMFLRFIERKGWLAAPNAGGSRDYLRHLFNDVVVQASRLLPHTAAGTAAPQGSSFFVSRLQPLFFEALAVEGKQESPTLGRVPFLNGGLFEKNDLDRLVDDLPDASFASLLGDEGLFYRYNFTVQESTPLDIEVAVDPEMLGKVFEELVTGRHESGSYYTPRPVVSFMCREGLKGYLADAAKIDGGKIALFVDKHDVRGITIANARAMAHALDNLRAVDPACGSGAYLLGLLHEIVDLYRLLYSDKLKNDARELHRIKLDIIQKSLYGVDKDPFATNIAMLRLWLSLTVDSDEPAALPNLDFKIETGDSLTGPDPQQYGMLHLHEPARQLAILKGQYMRARGEKKQSLRRLIQKDQKDLAFQLLSLCPGSIDWRVQFCEVFFSDRAGFDIVLANPPYVRKENIPDDIKPKLRDNFAEAITGRSDLYCSFYARGMQLLRPGGMHIFICSSSWLDAEYGAPLQHYLLQEGDVVKIIDSDVEKQFSTANVNTIISIIRKREGDASDQFESAFILLQDEFEKAAVDVQFQSVFLIKRQDLISAGGGRNYIGAKWGGELLRAPQIYRDIMQRNANRFVNLSSVAKILGYIHDDNTGDAFEKRRLIWGATDISRIHVTTNDPRVQMVGVKPTGNSCTFAPILFQRTCGERHMFPWITGDVLGKEFYKIVPYTNRDGLLLAAQLNSTFGMLQREILGIRGFGGGALKFAARDVGLFKVIPDLPSADVEEAFTKMANRDILNPKEEIKQDDRRQLDRILFDALELTQKQREAVYAAAIDLVEARSTRARS